MIAYISSTTAVPFAEARNRLSELIDEVASTHERIEITRHGRAVAVLISADDLAALEDEDDRVVTVTAIEHRADAYRSR